MTIYQEENFCVQKNYRNISFLKSGKNNITFPFSASSLLELKHKIHIYIYGKVS